MYNNSWKGGKYGSRNKVGEAAEEIWIYTIATVPSNEHVTTSDK